MFTVLIVLSEILLANGDAGSLRGGVARYLNEGKVTAAAADQVSAALFEEKENTAAGAASSGEVVATSVKSDSDRIRDMAGDELISIDILPPDTFHVNPPSDTGAKAEPSLIDKIRVLMLIFFPAGSNVTGLATQVTAMEQSLFGDGPKPDDWPTSLIARVDAIAEQMGHEWCDGCGVRVESLELAINGKISERSQSLAKRIEVLEESFPCSSSCSTLQERLQSLEDEVMDAGLDLSGEGLNETPGPAPAPAPSTTPSEGKRVWCGLSSRECLGRVQQPAYWGVYNCQIRWDSRNGGTCTLEQPNGGSNAPCGFSWNHKPTPGSVDTNGKLYRGCQSFTNSNTGGWSSIASESEVAVAGPDPDL